MTHENPFEPDADLDAFFKDLLKPSPDAAPSIRSHLHPSSLDNDGKNEATVDEDDFDLTSEDLSLFFEDKSSSPTHDTFSSSDIDALFADIDTSAPEKESRSPHGKRYSHQNRPSNNSTSAEDISSSAKSASFEEFLYNLDKENDGEITAAFLDMHETTARSSSDTATMSHRSLPKSMRMRRRALTQVYRLWNWITKRSRTARSRVIPVIFIAALLVGWRGYLSIIAHNVSEAYGAARTVADLSMALTHAHLMNAANQSTVLVDYSDPVFLSSHYDAVLPAAYKKPFPLDSKGLITGTSYTVTILVDPSSKKHALWVTPKQTLLQRFFPKPSYLVDSTTMTIRDVTTPALWQEIFDKDREFTSHIAETIASLATQEPLVPLNALDSEDLLGFTPPANLAKKYPSAENLIYNAPRYFPFDRELLSFISSIASSTKKTDSEAKTLSFIENTFSSRRNMVLYSPVKSQAEYENFLHYVNDSVLNGFIIGYITLDKNSGAISRAVLTKSFLVSAPKQRSTTQIPSENSPERLSSHKDEPSIKTAETSIRNTFSDQQNELTQRIAERHTALSSISEEMESLMTAFNKKSFASFDRQYSKLVKRYRQEAQSHRIVIGNALENLFASSAGDTTFSSFKSTVDSLDLYGYITPSFRNKIARISPSLSLSLATKNLPKDLELITSLQEIGAYLTELLPNLPEDVIDNDKELLSIQSYITNAVLKKISELLVNEDKGISNELFEKRNRSVIDSILTTLSFDKRNPVLTFSGFIERLSTEEEHSTLAEAR